MGELKDVIIRLASDPSIHQIVDIYVVEIIESYGILISRYWSTQLGGYFSIDWSHLLIPKKGQGQYKIIEQEWYMKQIVTDLEAQNVPVIFTNSILGNYLF